MYKSDAHNSCMQSLHTIVEVRTRDDGKLLFQITDKDGEAFLLIKRKGEKCVHQISVRDLNALIQSRLL